MITLKAVLNTDILLLGINLASDTVLIDEVLLILQNHTI